MLNKCISVLILLGLVSGLSALELQRGKLKLVINEKNGRFVIWGAEDQAKPVWTPLFLADDPTTSKWKLQVGDKTVVLGDDSSFSTAVETSETGASITWTSRNLVASLSFEFLVSVSSTVTDGLRLGLSLVNVSNSSAKVGVRWVLDTNLGEKKEHFRLSSGTAIATETKLDGNYPDSWASRSTRDDQIGLMVMIGKASTPPSRVIFANWKRLDDSVWDFPYKQGRDFNLLPYSFNDSAVAQYYDAQDLPPGSSRNIVVILGLLSAQNFIGARIASANPLEDLLRKNQDSSLGVIGQDMASLQTLLNQIDAKLLDPTHASPEDLKMLQAILDQIDSRKKILEASKP
jgi:hypothetical protein